ncbi:MAG: curli assembly protein CsgF [Pedobacter sp.]|nr:curli assembly protein CsgF [Pedobacter sp.]
MKHLPLFAVIFCSMAFSSFCAAGELVYQPSHPAFGGSPLNGPVLLNEANAQNTYKDPSAPKAPRVQTELEKFNERLQSAVLNRIANSLTQNIVGDDGNLQPGTVETVSFIINITDSGEGTLVITTTDKNTGATSTFEILNPTSTP